MDPHVYSPRARHLFFAHGAEAAFPTILERGGGSLRELPAAWFYEHVSCANALPATRLAADEDYRSLARGEALRALDECRSLRRLEALEDRTLVDLLHGAVPDDHAVSVAGELQPEHLNLALTYVEEHGLIGATMVFHPDLVRAIEAWGEEFYDPADAPSPEGLFGHMYSADLFAWKAAPPASLLVLAQPTCIGNFCQVQTAHRDHFDLGEESSVVVAADVQTPHALARVGLF